MAGGPTATRHTNDESCSGIFLGRLLRIDVRIRTLAFAGVFAYVVTNDLFHFSLKVAQEAPKNKKAPCVSGGGFVRSQRPIKL
jgi:hypothetical protein